MKQASLQFNIWKQCIEQREADGMLFSVIISILVVAFCLVIDNMISAIAAEMELVFGVVFIGQQHVFINAELSKLEEACPVLNDQFITFGTTLGYFNTIIIVTGLGYLTAIIQKFTIQRLKDNV